MDSVFGFLECAECLPQCIQAKTLCLDCNVALCVRCDKEHLCCPPSNAVQKTNAKCQECDDENKNQINCKCIYCDMHMCDDCLYTKHLCKDNLID